MVSIPPTYDPVQAQEFENRIATLETENRQLQAENRAVKAAFNQSQAELRQLKQQLEWEKRLFANSAYSFSEKFTIWAGKPLIEASKPNEQGMHHIPLYKVAPAIGASPKTVGRNFLKLAEATTDVKRATDRNETESGAWQTDVYVAFSEQLLTRPDTTTRLHPRNQGGKRAKRCQDCGSDNLTEQKMIICLNCGCEQSKTLRPVNSTNELADCRDEQEDDQEVNREPTDGQLDHRDITPDTCQVHDDDNGHDTHDPHNDDVTHDTAINITQPEDNLSSLNNQKESLDNLSIGEKEKPATPPVYPPTEYTPMRDHNDNDDHQQGGGVGFSPLDIKLEEEEEEMAEEGEQETRSSSLRKQRPTRDTLTREKDERGLPVYCLQCDCFATWYGAGCAPYCEEHWQGYKKPNNLADHGAP